MHASIILANKLQHLVLSLVALACCTLLSRADHTDSNGFEPRVFTNAAGRTIPYQLLRPREYQANRAYPLILFFHGAGERGTDNQKQLLHGTSLFLKPANREGYPCFVIAPQCPEKQQWVDMPWGTDAGERPPKPSDAMQQALGILDSALQEFRINTNRVYVTGLSMGGFATWDCLTRFPNRFAAAVPVCGGGDEKTVTAEAARVPVWAFHSDDDTVVKVTRTRHMIEAMRDLGGRPKYTELSGVGHNAWDTAYSEPELLPWLFSQQLRHTPSQ